MRILVVEDDKDVAGFVVRGLREAGHVVEHADNGRDGPFMAASEAFDAVILDRMLPGGIDGLKILETRVARRTPWPVLILSAHGRVSTTGCGPQGRRRRLSDQAVRLRGIACACRGAELPGQRRGSSDRHGGRGLETRPLSRQVKRAGQKVDLQPREFRLLEYLMRHAGQVVTRTMLLEGVWDYHFDPQTNVIDVHVSRLRQKVDKPFPTGLIYT